MGHHQRLFTAMEEQSIDALLLCGQGNVTYCSGYETPVAHGAMADMCGGVLSFVFVDGKTHEIILVVPAQFYTAAKQCTGVDEVLSFEVFHFFHKVEGIQALQDCFKELFARRIKEAKRVGIEVKRLPVLIASMLVEQVRNLQMIDVEEMMLDARRVKSPREIELIAHAARIEDAGQKCMREHMHRGGSTTELDIWADLCLAMNKAAGQNLFVVGDLATGPRTNDLYTALGPKERTIQRGDTCLLDISIRLNGYWCDCANTFVFGAEPNAEQQRYYSAVHEAYLAGMEQLLPGNCMSEVNRAMTEVFKKYRMEPVVYGGHQIGCGVNDDERITCYAQGVLEAGMVVCIEPQSYSGNAGATGVRLERVIHVTERGPVELNSFEWGITL
ncbi:MAG: Xaa-Pro peptidase family protein [Eubacteriales bacterium]|nr:Xaa-Pro peptidase family protein [Eubacteriales bacterium]